MVLLPFLLLFGTLSAAYPAQYGSPIDCETDLVLLVDNSKYVNADLLNIEKFSLELLLNRTHVSEDSVRVAVISFNKRPTVHLRLSESYSMEAVREALDGIPVTPGKRRPRRHSHKAFRKACRLLKKEGRRDHNKVIVYLTAGPSRNLHKAIEQVEMCKERGITVMAWSLYDTIRDELGALASFPHAPYVMDSEGDFMQFLDTVDCSSNDELTTDWPTTAWPYSSSPYYNWTDWGTTTGYHNWTDWDWETTTGYHNWTDWDWYSTTGYHNWTDWDWYSTTGYHNWTDWDWETTTGYHNWTDWYSTTGYYNWTDWYSTTGYHNWTDWYSTTGHHNWTDWDWETTTGYHNWTDWETTTGYHNWTDWETTTGYHNWTDWETTTGYHNWTDWETTTPNYNWTDTTPGYNWTTSE